MFYINKRLRQFSAAHRLIKGYEGKCRDLHGHNYFIEVTITAEQLNEYDFVIDFDDIKQHLDEWVQEHWDHATLVSEMDAALIAFLKKEKQTYFVIPGDKNTTAECLAEFLFHRFTEILSALSDINQRITLSDVRVFESENASAGYRAGLKSF